MDCFVTNGVYEDFLDGAKSGVRTVVEIMPTLVGLMVAVGILRASGFLDFLADLLAKGLAFTHFPTELVPIAIVKMFSSSAATGLLLDLYKEHGTDSMIGLAASIMLSSTETIFLYNVDLFYDRQSQENALYTGRSAYCDISRNRCIRHIGANGSISLKIVHKTQKK